MLQTTLATLTVWIIMAITFLGKMLLPLVLLGLLQYWICKKKYRWHNVLPILCLVFLIGMEILMLSIVSTNGVSYGLWTLIFVLFMLIPFGSPLLVTFIVSVFMKRNNKKDDLEKMKINDL